MKTVLAATAATADAANDDLGFQFMDDNAERRRPEATRPNMPLQ